MHCWTTPPPPDADAARAALTPDTVAKYLFTSRSTGAPKAVITTNAMISASQAMVRDCDRFLTDQPPVVLDWDPWNHTAAGNKVSYLLLTKGGTCYIDDGRPAGGKCAETLRNLRDIPYTWWSNVPVGDDMLFEPLETDGDLARSFFADLGMPFYAGASMSQRTWDGLSAIGRDVTGRDVTGRDVTGRDVTGRDVTGRDVLLATGLGPRKPRPSRWQSPV